MSDTNDRIDILVKKNEKTGLHLYSRFALEHHVLISLTRVTYTTHNTHPVSLSHMPTHNNATRILRNTSNTGTRERPVVLFPYVLLSFEDSSPSSPWHVTRTTYRRSFDLHHRSVRARSARISIISLSCFNYTNVKCVSLKTLFSKYSNYEEHHSHRSLIHKKITRKSTLECKLEYYENLTRASRSNTGNQWPQAVQDVVCAVLMPQHKVNVNRIVWEEGFGVVNSRLGNLAVVAAISSLI